MILRSILGFVVVVAWGQLAAAGEPIRGAGATFPAPVYAAWGAAYEAGHGVKVVYDPVGSGVGLERIRGHLVDFGGSDAPLGAEELASAGLVQFPVIVGGVVPVINITGIGPGELRLSGGVLAEIYLGRIRKWNDRQIAQLNPGLALPNTNITVVHRSDPSGSSLLWTRYLSQSSDAWQAAVGASLTPKWPTGVGGTGNDGVASYVQRTRSAVGYVEYFYGRNHNLSDVALRNHSGEFVRAGQDSFSAAAEAGDWSAAGGFQQLPVDPAGQGSWPVSGASFILVDRSVGRAGATREVLRFFDWALHEGEPIARGLDYVPVPARVVEQMPQVWGTLRDGEGKALWPQGQ
jgi:phosphate transport system substrate-binding protein